MTGSIRSPADVSSPSASSYAPSAGAGVTSFLPSKMPADMRPTPRPLDEGYSEETRSASGQDEATMRGDAASDSQDVVAQPAPLPVWVRDLDEDVRSEFAYAILRSLKTSSIASIVDRLNPLLHLDPLLFLPPEITFQVFSYLDPQSLLTASRASIAWKQSTLDTRLWRRLFAAEGWPSNVRQVRAFEQTERERNLRSKKESRIRARSTDATDDWHSNKRRAFLEKTLTSEARALTLDNDGQGTAGGSSEERAGGPSPDMMQGVELSGQRSDPRGVMAVQSPTQTSPPLEKAAPQRLLVQGADEPKLDWYYLYKQRRRLEANWNAGRYKNFQLPHPDFPSEAHRECVYTIQYSGQYLVSGSRDQTIRIWNLNTQRLVHPPLKGHKQSVLCLQFDDRPEEDIIISGGSDADVILWQFSTGKMMRKMPKAHKESVLNLRFDDYFLVTCSKDKTVKIWNRKSFRKDPGEDFPEPPTGDPFAPIHIINMRRFTDNDPSRWLPMEEYNLCMVLDGHGAAVNAIQILDDQVVSASGDRTVKIWDLCSGMCLKTLLGHSKGIACVEFDGKRVVTGSSDETVRIFDRATTVEVACLIGHSNLVRTVQARFGDLPGSEEELELEARRIDQKFFAAQKSGLIKPETSGTRRRTRNAGSSDPSEITAYGAKIPPGGGGSRWGRIVSGSYDESVIIWKKDNDGKWTIARRLLQAEALRSASGGRPMPPNPRRGHHHPHPHPLAHPHHHHGHAPAPAGAVPVAGTGVAAATAAAHDAQQQPQLVNQVQVPHMHPQQTQQALAQASMDHQGQSRQQQPVVQRAQAPQGQAQVQNQPPPAHVGGQPQRVPLTADALLQVPTGGSQVTTGANASSSMAAGNTVENGNTIMTDANTPTPPMQLTPSPSPARSPAHSQSQGTQTGTQSQTQSQGPSASLLANAAPTGSSVPPNAFAPDAPVVIGQVAMTDAPPPSQPAQVQTQGQAPGQQGSQPPPQAQPQTQAQAQQAQQRQLEQLQRQQALQTQQQAQQTQHAHPAPVNAPGAPLLHGGIAHGQGLPAQVHAHGNPHIPNLVPGGAAAAIAPGVAGAVGVAGVPGAAGAVGVAGMANVPGLAAGVAGVAGVAGMPNQGNNARVFKLQFDSRRIICCSQDPRIVVWDFANGDAEIEVASRFFGERD